MLGIRAMVLAGTLYFIQRDLFLIPMAIARLTLLTPWLMILIIASRGTEDRGSGLV